MIIDDADESGVSIGVRIIRLFEFFIDPIVVECSGFDVGVHVVGVVEGGLVGVVLDDGVHGLRCLLLIDNFEMLYGNK